MQSIYTALEDAPPGLRGLLYLLLTLLALAAAPIVGLVLAVRWLGTNNRLPSIGELAFALSASVIVVVVWAFALTFLLADGFVVGASDCPADVVRAAMQRACEE
jgi:hypothetical protein